MNISGYTQLEIEEFFDDSNLRDMLTAEYEIFFNNVDEKHLATMFSILKTEEDDDVTDVFIYILSIIGNEKVGMRVGVDNMGQECSIKSNKCVNIIPVRDIDVVNLCKAISRCPVIVGYTTDPLRRFDYAMDIIAEFDGILFDLHKKTVRLDDGQFTTVTYARSEVVFREESALKAQYNRFRLPMIETPDIWTEKERGGYKLNKKKVTTNRGEGNQPQNVLDVLNKLQSQPYKLAEHVNAEEENMFLYESLAKKSANAMEAQQKADVLCITTRDTYEALAGRTFYFEWRFDFRGRLYTTGYDVNLQANKYKKGAILPA